MNWWTDSDVTAFKERANKLVNQYNEYTVLDSLHVNGKLTLGENIADLGGLSIAYEAFRRTKEFQEKGKISGFTPAQRFFLSYAQSMRYIATPEIKSKLLVIDFHAPSEYRINGTLTNFSPWYEAFGITAADYLYKAPEKRYAIW